MKGVDVAVVWILIPVMNEYNKCTLHTEPSCMLHVHYTQW